MQTLLKEAQRKEDEEKRNMILREKQTKEQFLLDHLNQISLHRAARGKANVLKFFKVDGSLYQQNVGTCSAASVFVTHSNMPILARLAEKNSPTNSTTPFTFSSVFLGSFHVQ
ncbi:UNVERIFIED_CONTAM: hypothetical protein FKN15_067879 [Acipenser sinensis]